MTSAKRFLLLIFGLAALAVGGYAGWRYFAQQYDERKTEEGAGRVEVASEQTTRNWPRMFGPFNNSTSAETGLQLDWPKSGPKVVWRKPIGSGYSSPIVWGDRLIVFHRKENEEILECLHAETGDSLWQDRGPTAYQCRYEYSSGPYGTPVTDGERVYAAGAEGRFYCVDLKTGDVLWRRFLTKEYDVEPGYFAVAASPLIEDGKLLFNLGGRKKQAGIVALDCRTGKTLWTATDHGAGYATPRAATIHGRRVVFVLTLDGLVCLNPADGQVHWVEPFKANNPEYANATTPLVHGDLVFVSVYRKGSFCARIRPDLSREILWRQRRGFQSQYSTLIGIDGHVFGFDASSRTFNCVRLNDGEIQWRWPDDDDEGVGRGQAIAIADRFLLFGEYGNLASIDINTFKPIQRSLSGELLKRPCYSSPALANGRLYLRNEREIVCFDLRKK